MERWIFELKQRGIVVACGEGPDRDEMLREAAHYTMMYGQDGPCETIVRLAAEDEDLPETKKPPAPDGAEG